ncbi:MAG: hypothetical protein J5726_02755 [Treponema sp.]|nr:hypothetical protein [Treponema sp.]
MAVSLKKKLVTIYFQELKYLMFQQIAKEQNRKTAELVRDAMDEYLENHAAEKKAFSAWKPVSLGGLKDGAKDWISKDYQEEILGSAF